MLDAKNAYWKLIAVRLLANLVAADSQNKFERLFDKYYDLLGDSVIIAGHVTANSGKIARAKPELQAAITDRLLNIDKTTQKHKDLIKSGAIESFGEYFAGSKDKEKILAFVRQQLKGESPKTRKIAREFLGKWEN
jgi:ABC-type phosphate/phosphonate transport system substrate-binding protein